MRDHDISQRRACKLAGVDPKAVRRERRPDCAEIRKEMQEIAGKRRRFGYRRIGVLLERKGLIMNHKKLHRIYREGGPSVKRRRGRKRAWRAPIGWSGLIVSASWAGGPLERCSVAWRAVAQRVVCPDRVVVDAPLLDQDLRFAQSVEHLSIEQLIVEPGVEAFTISVFPR
jgi:transposase InsO family protein